MNDLAIYASPLLCGAIGWGTNWLAVKMLFRPRQPVRVLGFTIQGVFPKRHQALAERLAHLVETQLFSHKDVQAYLQEPAFQARLHALMDEYLDSLIKDVLPTRIPMLAMFLNENLAPKIKELLAEQFERLTPRLINALAQELEESLSVKETVRAKIEAFSMEQLEGVLVTLMKKEFKFIEVSGGVLGVLVGLAQAGLLLATQ
ncbi:MAG: DUF445 family protein [Desulfovibrio sp.]|nr:DUF445 family protein [Desulfovibrio sp.]MCA1985581.1 DUF445 family protein [Desulfovibrio sp.]